MPKAEDSWTSDRLVRVGEGGRHAPFKLQLYLPTSLSPGYTRTLRPSPPTGPRTTDTLESALAAEGYGIVAKWKLSVSHHRAGREYPRGSELFLAEHDVRVDVTQNDRGRKRFRAFVVAGLGAIILLALLDVLYPRSFWWVIPMSLAITAFFILALLSYGTSVFCSEVIAVSIPPSDDVLGSREPRASTTEPALEITGALVLSQNYSTQQGIQGRTVKRSVVSPPVREAVDRVAERMG